MVIALEPDEPDQVEAVLAPLTAAVEGAALRALSAVPWPGVTLQAGEARCPRGVQLDGRVAVVPALELLDVTADVDVAALLAAGAPASSPDLDGLEPLLDALSGHARLDAVVGLLASPLMPRVTSQVRLAIQDGQLDFRQLERGFHPLADAVLDFHVRGRRLELEKDIPLVPWDESTLVAWDLDARDQALAARDRIRLRRLLDARVLEAGPRTAGGAGCYGLGSLALEELDVALSVPLGAQVPLAGGTVTLGVEQVHARGAVRCARDGPAPRTSLALAVRGVQAALRGLSAQGAALDAEGLEVDEVTGEVAFDGLTPVRALLTAPRVRLHGVRLSVP